MDSKNTTLFAVLFKGKPVYRLPAERGNGGEEDDDEDDMPKAPAGSLIIGDPPSVYKGLGWAKGPDNGPPDNIYNFDVRVLILRKDDADGLKLWLSCETSGPNEEGDWPGVNEVFDHVSSFCFRAGVKTRRGQSNSAS